MSVKMAEDLVSGTLPLEQAGKLTRRMIAETARARGLIQVQLVERRQEIADLGAAPDTTRTQDAAPADAPEETGAQDAAPADDAANDAVVSAIKGWASSTADALGDGRGDKE